MICDPRLTLPTLRNEMNDAQRLVLPGVALLRCIVGYCAQSC